MATDPQCARCKRPIRPGWLYLIAHRRGQAATTEDDAVLIHVPDECHGLGARPAKLASEVLSYLPCPMAFRAALRVCGRSHPAQVVDEPVTGQPRDPLERAGSSKRWVAPVRR